MPFDEITIEQFGYLESEFGFELTVRRRDFVEYMSERTVVGIGYDSRRSYEVNLFVRLRSESESEASYDLGEILSMFDIDLEIGPSCPDASSIQGYLEAVSQVLRCDCKEVLSGSASVYQTLAQLRDRACGNYALAKSLRVARATASQAWRAKDYRGVVEALTPYLEHLEKSERQRIAIAKRMAAG